MITIESRAYDDTAREMERDGVDLSFEQADLLGEDGIDWLEQRLGLRCQETDTCVECEVRS